jgi:hypothetical protein
LAKTIFSFTPDIVMSPLALPRSILDRIVDAVTGRLPGGALRDVLLQLKTRPTFAEQWPNEYSQGLIKGKRRILQLEKIRNDSYTLGDILAQDTEIKQWWDNVKTN